MSACFYVVAAILRFILFVYALATCFVFFFLYILLLLRLLLLLLIFSLSHLYLFDCDCVCVRCSVVWLYEWEWSCACVWVCVYMCVRRVSINNESCQRNIATLVVLFMHRALSERVWMWEQLCYRFSLRNVKTAPVVDCTAYKSVYASICVPKALHVLTHERRFLFFILCCCFVSLLPSWRSRLQQNTDLLRC